MSPSRPKPGRPQPRGAPAGEIKSTVEDTGRRLPVTEVVLRVAAVAGAVWGSVLLAFVGALLTPFRLGGVLVPVSLLLAVVGNVTLIVFLRYAVPGRFLPLSPGLVWLAVAFWASGATSEGDVLLAANNWVAAGYLLAGSATVAVAAYKVILPPAS